MSIPISIVIPNYNSGTVLERAIRSLLAQNYPDLQIILMDSCSTDESREIIERFRSSLHTVVIEKDQGQADALNKGFALASGDLFGWLCADDELMPGTLEHIAGIFEKDPSVDVVTGACERVFPDGTVLLVAPPQHAWDIIGIQDPIEQSATFWRAPLHRRTGSISAQYHMVFDWDFWNRFKNANARLVVTDRLLSRYYFSDTNKTGTAGRRFTEEAFTIVQRYAPWGVLLARIYRFLYLHFDLHGCYDRPPTCTVRRSRQFVRALWLFNILIGEKRLHQYNWHFAACQERGLKWW